MRSGGSGAGAVMVWRMVCCRVSVVVVGSSVAEVVVLLR